MHLQRDKVISTFIELNLGSLKEKVFSCCVHFQTRRLLWTTLALSFGVRCILLLEFLILSQLFLFISF
ncbi:hypothetical protein Peur_048350 [Populus x canadensis]